MTASSLPYHPYAFPRSLPVTLYATLITLLAGASLAALALAFALAVALMVPSTRAALVEGFVGRAGHPIGWAWGVALIASAGSLYLSEIVGFVPCLFCWYQRIAMYPLVLVLGVGMLRGDASVWRYALPLPVVGLLIAAYHVTIQLQPSMDVGVCTEGVSCSARYLAVFGFVSIPVMAGAGFLLVAVLMAWVRSIERAETWPDEEEGGR